MRTGALSTQSSHAARELDYNCIASTRNATASGRVLLGPGLGLGLGLGLVCVPPAQQRHLGIGALLSHLGVDVHAPISILFLWRITHDILLISGV
jgi:hypothetical protein